jgi:hypothetical protein
MRQNIEQSRPLFLACCNFRCLAEEMGLKTTSNPRHRAECDYRPPARDDKQRDGNAPSLRTCGSALLDSGEFWARPDFPELTLGYATAVWDTEPLRVWMFRAGECMKAAEWSILA